MAKKEAKINENRAIKSKTLMLAQTGILAAIMLIFHFTGIGYIKLGVFSLTIMAVPMIIGAIVAGKTSGAILGALFGITVMALPETQLFVGINPAFAILICVGTRIFLGFFCGLIFELFYKLDKTKLWSFGASGLITALLNTAFVLGGIALLFGSNPEVLEAFGMLNVTKAQVFTALVIASALQAIIEALICMLIGGACAKAVYLLEQKQNNKF